MSNPTFFTGELTRKAGKPVEKFRLVKEVDGKVEHNDAATFPFGVVTEAAAPAGPRSANDLSFGYPENVRVGTSQRVVKIETDGEITAGHPVFAADEGKVSATGTVKIGLADKATGGSLTRVHLYHPTAIATSTSS